MSRIYQGGQSQGNYKAKEKRSKYIPAKIVSNRQAILDEGKQQLENAKTLDREAKRSNQMEDLERKGSDQLATLTLKEEQARATRELQLAQTVQKAELEITNNLAESLLKMSQTTEKGQVSIEQLADKNTLELNELRDKALLELNQKKDKNSLESSQSLSEGLLKLDQSTKSNALKLTQQGDRLGLKYTQDSDLANQKLQHQAETDLLKSEQSAIRADNNLATQYQQYSANVDNANFNTFRTTVNSLISFGSTVSTEVAKNQEIQRKNEEAKASAIRSLPGKIQVDGSLHPSIVDDALIDQENIAREQGIQEVSNGDTVMARRMREPSIKIQTVRSLAQADIREKAGRYGARLNDTLRDPSTQIPYKGQVYSFQEFLRVAESEDDIMAVIDDVGDAIGNADQLLSSDGPEAIKAYGNQATMAIQNAKSHYGSIYGERLRNQSIDATQENVASLMGAKEYSRAWQKQREGYYLSAKYSKLSNSGIDKIAFEKMVDLMDVDTAQAFLGVEKVPGNKGTVFEKDPILGPILLKGIKDKISSADIMGTIATEAKEKEVDSVITALDAQLSDTTDPQKSLELRNQAKDFLRSNFAGNPYAEEKIAELTEARKTSEPLKMQVLEGINNGFPPSKADLLKWEKSGALDAPTITNIRKNIKLNDEVLVEMQAAGLDKLNVETKIRGVINKAQTALAQVPRDQRTAAAAMAARQIAPMVEGEMRRVIAQLPKDMPQAEKTRLINQAYDAQIKNLTDALIVSEPGEHAFDPSGKFDFSRLGDNYGTMPTSSRVSPITGRTIFDHSRVAITDLDPGASSEDQILSRETFAKDAEVWNQGGSDYSARTVAAADRFNLTPRDFVKQQALANGYKNIHDGVSKNTKVDFSNPQSTYNTFLAAGLTNQAAEALGGRVGQVGIDTLNDAIESDPVRLARAEEFLGGSWDNANPRQKLDMLMNDLKTFDQSAYRILRSPNSTNIQINRSIDEYLKGQQPINFPVIDTRISTGNPSAFQYRGASTQTFLSASVPGGYGQTIAASSAKHGVDPGIMAGLLHQESGYSPDVINGTRVSSAGAQGIAQIMTEYHPGVNPLNPTEAIDYGASYLARLLKRYNGDYRLALTAYNAGEGNVDRYGGPIPGNKESEEYANLVMQHARTYGWGQ